MRNRTYGGVRGRKTKVGEKLLRFPPTRLFATGCTRYEYINLIDEDEQSAPIDTTTRGNQGSSFDFDTCDSEPIEVYF